MFNIVLFDLYCYSEEIYMMPDEFKFMIEKLITTACATLLIKRSYLAEIYKNVENKIIIQREKIYRNEFVNVLRVVLRESRLNIDELSQKISTFS